jgi:hypothetical protein
MDADKGKQMERVQVAVEVADGDDVVECGYGSDGGAEVCEGWEVDQDVKEEVDVVGQCLPWLLQPGHSRSVLRHDSSKERERERSDEGKREREEQGREERDRSEEGNVWIEDRVSAREVRWGAVIMFNREVL